jgi:hypothetical protein
MELWLPLVDFYLNLRYRNIVGHVGLVRFYHSLNNSGMPSRGTVKRIGGTMITRVMSHLLLVLMHYRTTFFGWIDDSIHQIQVPFSGLDGDYKGVPRRVQYIDAHESVYSGWKKLHGIKVETVNFPMV